MRRYPTISPSELYTYPEHLREQVAAAPAAPGVYLFYGDDGPVPLYIGKSVNIRSRLLTHLRNADAARLLRQSRRIEYRRTAGELGALLLESRLIKEMKPLYNKRLRRNRHLCSLHLQDGKVDYVHTTQPTGNHPLYGLFKNRRAATAFLIEIADAHGLCLAVMGVENWNGRRCFRAQLGRCRGACAGHESVMAHTLRLQTVLEQVQVHHWPFPGAIALHEQFDELEEFHVINRWHYLGSYTSSRLALQTPTNTPLAFDADSYKILVKPIMKAALDGNYIPLGN